MNQNGTFLVDTTTEDTDGEVRHIQTTMLARTSHEAETYVRRAANRNASVVWFRVDLVREVVTVWNHETGRYDIPVVRITDSWAHSLPEVMHR